MTAWFLASELIARKTNNQNVLLLRVDLQFFVLFCHSTFACNINNNPVLSIITRQLSESRLITLHVKKTNVQYIRHVSIQID